MLLFQFYDDNRFTSSNKRTTNTQFSAVKKKRTHQSVSLDFKETKLISKRQRAKENISFLFHAKQSDRKGPFFSLSKRYNTFSS
jgi:hypothetical protein